jgi:hypothetical protein
MSASIAFPAGGALIGASWATIALLGPKWQYPLLFVALYGAAFAGYILTALLVRHHRNARLAPALLIGIGLAARAVALPAAHAWYFTIILLLLCVIPWTGSLLLSGSLGLPFLARSEIVVTGQRVEWHGVKWIAYPPLYAWLLAWLVIRLRGSGGALRANGRLSPRTGEQD